MGLRCSAEVTRGHVCAACGREHRHIITGKVILWATGILAATAIVWVFTSENGHYLLYSMGLKDYYR